MTMDNENAEFDDMDARSSLFIALPVLLLFGGLLYYFFFHANPSPSGPATITENAGFENAGFIDSDNDGIADHIDQCINERGYLENLGCPAATPTAQTNDVSLTAELDTENSNEPAPSTGQIVKAIADSTGIAPSAAESSDSQNSTDLNSPSQPVLDSIADTQTGLKTEAEASAVVGSPMVETAAEAEARSQAGAAALAESAAIAQTEEEKPALTEAQAEPALAEAEQAAQTKAEPTALAETELAVAQEAEAAALAEAEQAADAEAAALAEAERAAQVAEAAALAEAERAAQAEAAALAAAERTAQTEAEAAALAEAKRAAQAEAEAASVAKAERAALAEAQEAVLSEAQAAVRAEAQAEEELAKQTETAVPPPQTESQVASQAEATAAAVTAIQAESSALAQAEAAKAGAAAIARIRGGVESVNSNPQREVDQADTDGDGLIDVNDACPNTPGATSQSGCPSDIDNDGVDDQLDKCPDIAGDIRNAGCPVSNANPTTDAVALDTPSAAATTDTDALVENKEDQTTNVSAERLIQDAGFNIRFNAGNAVLTEGSREILVEVAKVMERYPDIQLEAHGFTDSEGTASFNEEISLARAQACIDVLFEAGIDKARLKAIGFGAERPIATNQTASGRRKNRRVEFKLVR